MINTLINGIADKLKEVFDITIYAEEIPQGFVTPCFYVKCLTHTDNLMLYGNKKKITPFDISYFPTEGTLTAQKEMNDVLAKLADNMRVIDAGGNKIKGYDISSQKIDNVLHYFISYNFIQLNKEEKIKMGNLKERVGANGR